MVCLERITGMSALKACLAFLEGHLPRSFYFVQHIKLLIEFGEGDFEIYNAKEKSESKSFGAILSICRDILVKEEKFAVFYEDRYVHLAQYAMKTKIDMSFPHYLNNMPEYQLPILPVLYGDRNNPKEASVESENKCFTMALNDIAKLPDPLPEAEHIVRRINPDQAGIICSNWKFNRPGVEGMLREVLETRIGYGAFIGDQMVSWIIQSKYGYMGSLHTLPEARGRGYATMVVNKLCRHIWALGITPAVDVEADNIASFNLFTKYGFEVQEKSSWIRCRPRLD